MHTANLLLKFDSRNSFNWSQDSAFSASSLASTQVEQVIHSMKFLLSVQEEEFFASHDIFHSSQVSNVVVHQPAQQIAKWWPCGVTSKNFITGKSLQEMLFQENKI